MGWAGLGGGRWQGWRGWGGVACGVEVVGLGAEEDLSAGSTRPGLCSTI